MTCLECIQQLQRAMDGDALEPPPEFARHLAGCPSCAGLHAAGEILLRGLKKMPAPVLAPDFSRRMAGLVAHDRSVRRRRLRRRLRITMALAASILIMAVAGYFLMPIPPNSPAGDPFAMENQQKTPAHDANPPRLAQSVDDARQAVAKLSERLANEAQEQTKNLLAAAPALEIPGWKAEPLEIQPAAQTLQDASVGLAQGLQPAAQTTKRAFTFFVHELPVLSDSH